MTFDESIFFGSICGSILAAIVAIGGIMIPQMVKHGYSRAFSAALCAAVAGVDSLIPPSNIAIIYSSITGIPVGKTFMAGLIPGIFQACVLSLYCIIISGKIKHVAPASWKQRLNATYRALPICLMPILILGGIYTGVFSAVEAAGLASVYALIVSGFIYRELSLSGLWEALVETVITTAIIFALVAGAAFLSVALTYTQIPQKITEYTLSYGVSPIFFIFACAVVWMILGTFLEAIPNLYITVPIMFPIAITLGLDLVHLYVICCVFVGIGLMTPPVCVGAYTAAAVANELPEKIIRILFPTIILILMVIGVVNILFPPLATWLPSMMR